MGFALSIIFVIYGGICYLVGYLIDSGRKEAFIKEADRRWIENSKDRMEKYEAENSFSDALDYYLDGINGLE